MYYKFKQKCTMWKIALPAFKQESYFAISYLKCSIQCTPLWLTWFTILPLPMKLYWKGKILPMFHTWDFYLSCRICNIPAWLVCLLFQVLLTYVHNYDRNKRIIKLLQNIHLIWAKCSGFTCWAWLLELNCLHMLSFHINFSL